MYSNKISVTQNLAQQLLWKYSTYSQMVSTIVGVQFIFTLLAFNGTGSSSSGTAQVSVQEQFYSLDLMLFISIFALFVISWVVTNKSIIHENFSIPTTRLTAHSSTVLFLISLCALATITALCTLYISIFARMVFTDVQMVMPSTLIDFEALILLFFSLLLAAAGGYFIGSLIYVSKLFIIAFVAVLFIIFRNYIENIQMIIHFYFGEDVFSYVIKALVSAILLFGTAIALKNRKEVRGL